MSQGPRNRWKRLVRKVVLEIRDRFSSIQLDAYCAWHEIQKQLVKHKFMTYDFHKMVEAYCYTYLATLRRIKSSSKAGSNVKLFFAASFLEPSSSHKKRSRQLLRSIDRISYRRTKNRMTHSYKTLVTCLYLQDSISVSKSYAVRKLTNCRSPFPSLKSKREIA